MDVDAGMLLELESWRRAGSDPDRRVDVFVSYEGGPAALTAAGLDLGHHDGAVATGSVRLADVAALAAVDGVGWVSRSARTHLLIDRSMGEIKATALRSSAPPYTVGGVPGLTGKGVLVGVIDDMISEFHQTFIRPGTVPEKTRLVGIWDQKLLAPRPGQVSPPGFSYGVYWTEDKINDVLFRRDTHAIGLTADYDHGSHVTGIAAGNGLARDGRFPPFTFVGVAPEADIAFSNAAFSPSARIAGDALKFLFAEATRRGQPCVVNMSFGTHEGARDGTSDLELAIDRALHGPDGEPLPGRAVVVAAGNEADAGRHGRKSVAANGTITFRLDIEPIKFPNGKTLSEDLISDYLYLWYDGAASLDLRITPARATPSDWISPGQSITVSAGGAVMATVAAAAGPEPRNGKRQIVVSLPGPVRLGRWTIELRETAGAAATVDLWVDRSDIDIWPQLANGENIIENTVTSPATSRSVITVGNYVSEPDILGGEHYGEIFRSSSRGLDSASGATPDQVRPHLVAPGRRIISANLSQYVLSSAPYFRLRFDGLTMARHLVVSGTSQAAPHVTGVVALMFQRNPTLTYRDVRRILMDTARRDQIPAGLVLPNAVWGAGKVDAEAALAATPPGGGP